MRYAGFVVEIHEGREVDAGYVQLPHGAVYSIVLGNEMDRPCDAWITIDGKTVGGWRVPARMNVNIERPVHDTGRFTFYQIGSHEAQLAALADNDSLGLVTVEFRPERKPNPTSRSNKQGLRSGGTGLTGHSEQEFVGVEALRYDEHEIVIIHLRLLALPSDTPRPLTAAPSSTPIPPRLRGGW